MENPGQAWRNFRATNSPKLREELVQHYQGLVRNLALELRGGAQMEDLIASGQYGLEVAIDGYDPDRGFKFETYATPIVRGAIYNGLRALDWLPERPRPTLRYIVAMLRANPTELTISTNEVYEMIASLGCSYLLGFEQLESQPEFPEQRDRLRRTIFQLDDRYRYVLTEHYFRCRPFESIARELGISLHRVRKLHAAALRRLLGSEPPPEAGRLARLAPPPKAGGPGNARA